MNNKFAIAMLSMELTAGCASLGGQTADKQPVMETDQQKSSYAQGVQYMKSLAQSEIPLDQELFLLGMNDVLHNIPLRLSPEQLQIGQDWVLVQHYVYDKKIGQENLEKGKAFLAANQKKTGVQVTDSGLQFEILVEGKNGPKPKLSDTALVHYRITRLDGVELTNTQNSPKTPEVQVGRLIKGWQEAMLLMAEGAKWRLYIPAELAYGEGGAPEGQVRQNETLIYDVELISIKPVASTNTDRKLLGGANGVKPSSSW